MMLFEDKYRSLFMVYRIFGISPCRYVPNQHSSGQTGSIKQKLIVTIEDFWIICVLAFELISFNHCFKIAQEKFSKRLDLYIVLGVLDMFVHHIHLIVTTIETFCKRNSQAKILQNLNEIDGILSSKLKLNIDYSQLKHSIYQKLVMSMFVYALAEIILPLHDRPISIFTIYALLKRALVTSKYVTFVIFIRYRVEAMHRALAGSPMWMQQNITWILMNQNRFSDFEAAELKRMINVWRIFNKIYEIVQLTNKTFKWSISVSFSIDIFIICALLFHFMESIFETKMIRTLDDEHSANICGVYMIFYVFNVGIIIQAANSVAEVANHFASEIQQFRSNDVQSAEYQNFVSKFFKTINFNLEKILRCKMHI